MAAVYLFRRGDARQRVVALMTISSYAYIVYSIARGTIEEQFFYLVTVPSIICSVAGFALFWRERASNSVALARLAAVGLVGIFAWNAYTYVNVHTTADNGYQRVAAYLDRCAAPGAPIAATTQTAAILFGTNHPTVSWASLNHLRQGNGTLVFVSSKIVAQHYQPVTTAPSTATSSPSPVACTSCPDAASGASRCTTFAGSTHKSHFCDRRARADERPDRYARESGEAAAPQAGPDGRLLGAHGRDRSSAIHARESTSCGTGWR